MYDKPQPVGTYSSRVLTKAQNAKKKKKGKKKRQNEKQSLASHISGTAYLAYHHKMSFMIAKNHWLSETRDRYDFYCITQSFQYL